MNWSNYKELSEKTLSREFHNNKKDELLLHALLGVNTELEELLSWNKDDVNKQEEIADIFWYIAILDRELDLKLEFSKKEYTKLLKIKNFFHRVFNTNNNKVLNTYKTCSLLLDFLKKKLYYNKEIKTNEFKTLSVKLFDQIVEFGERNNVDIEYILERNIEKLRARYGDKFTSERAINRDLENERKILEGNKLDIQHRG
jgi:NTP pyrophosphatase (non-canonical NTP hydrolase)